MTKKKLRDLTPLDFPGVDPGRFEEWKRIRSRLGKAPWLGWAIWAAGLLITVPLIGGFIGWTLPMLIWAGFMFGYTRPLAKKEAELARTARIDRAVVEQPFSGPGPIVALALIVLIVVGLIVRTRLHLRAPDLGFDAVNLVTMRVTLPEEHFASLEETAHFLQKVQQKVGGLPGTQGVCASTALPLFGQPPSVAFEVESAAPLPPGTAPSIASISMVSPNFFEVMKIPCRTGRFFDDSDAEAGRERVLVIDASLARRCWPDASPVGRRVRLGTAETYWTVIGVVGDVRQSLSEPNQPHLYVPISQAPLALKELRMAARTSSAVDAVRIAISAIDPRVSVTDAKTMEQHISTTLTRSWLNRLLFPGLAALVLLLALAVVYGLVARTRQRAKMHSGPMPRHG